MQQMSVTHKERSELDRTAKMRFRFKSRKVRHVVIVVFSFAFVVIFNIWILSKSYSRRASDISNEEVRHIVFLKVHKAASTTMMNLLMRFGLSRNLNIMVPRDSNVFSQSDILRWDQILHHTDNDVYDLVCCHVIYRKSAMMRYFPPDTKYVGIVRHPFEQFVSAFLFYRQRYSVPYLVNIPGENPIKTYLSNPSSFEPNRPISSFTNNRMAVDFGFPLDQFHNSSRMRSYAKTLDSELDFVIVVEYFDESLVMMKRRYGWQLKDILYIPRKYGQRNNSFSLTEGDIERHRQYAKLDYILYKNFLQSFKKKLAEQDDSFAKELGLFRAVRQRVESFCKESSAIHLTIFETQWNKEFLVSRWDCQLMMMEAIPLIDFVRNIYLTKGELIQKTS